MHLHQVTNSPDWSSTPRHKRNFWQRIAAKTNGVGTPGNILSIAGFVLVLIGLWIVVVHSLWEGTFLVGFGRLADILDGIIAHRTGTKSPLGRAIDATLDKIGAVLALSVFALHNILPVWVAAAILLQNVANILVSIYAPWRRIFLNPSEAGKIATAGFWLTIVVFVAGRLVAGSGMSVFTYPVLFIAYVLAFGSLFLGVIATGGYIIAVLQAPPHKRT